MEKISNLEIFYEVFVKNVLCLSLVRCLIFPTMLATITATYLEVKVSDIVRLLSNNISKKEDYGESLKYYFYFVLCAAFLSEVVGFVFTGVIQYIYRTINRNSFRQFISLGPRSFNHLGSGEIQAIIERKSKASSELVEVLIVNVFPVICILLFVSYSVFKKLGLLPCLLIIVSVFIYAMLTITIAVWRTGIRRKLNRAENIANNKLQDSLLNQETVYAYGTTELETNQYDEKLQNIQANANTLWRALYILNFSQKVVFLCQSTFIILLGARGYLNSSMSPSDLVYFISISKTLNGCLGNLGFMYSRFTQALLNAKSTFGMKRIKKEKKNLVRPTTTFNNSLSLIDVNFSYENKLVFKNVNFELKKGEKVAIVGRNGVGKSTLIKLLLRFENYEGSILLDGVDIQDINEESFRSIISYIPQNSFLFNESVTYNIKYGSKNVSDEEVYKLCKLFCCFETFSRLEKGFETNVGERGKLLSGGERQKILIMRALISHKDFFILDEPTSALDKDSELKVLNSLLFNKNTTVLMIIHNLELINKFDKILFIENNKVETIEKIHEHGNITSRGLDEFLKSSKISMIN